MSDDKPDRTTPPAESAEAAPKKAGSTPPPPPKWDFPAAPAAIITLITAGLTAVGLSGDLLGRAIRNYVAFAVVAAVLLGLAIGVSQRRWLKQRKAINGNDRDNIASGLIVTIMVVAIMVLGILSASAREQPRSVVSADTPKDGIIAVTVESSGSGLQSDERMLVYIRALRSVGPARGIEPGCPDAAAVDDEGQLTLTAEPVVPLSSQEYGPDATGKVVAATKIQLDDSYAGVCVYTVMQNRGRWILPDDVRRSQAFYLFGFPETTSASSSDSPPASPPTPVSSTGPAAPVAPAGQGSCPQGS